MATDTVKAIKLGQIQTPHGIADVIFNGREVIVGVLQPNGITSHISRTSLEHVIKSPQWGIMSHRAYFHLLKDHEWFIDTDKNTRMLRVIDNRFREVEAYSTLTPTHSRIWGAWFAWSKNPGGVDRPKLKDFGL